jgi:hypothetical protein
LLFAITTPQGSYKIFTQLFTASVDRLTITMLVQCEFASMLLIADSFGRMSGFNTSKAIGKMKHFNLSEENEMQRRLNNLVDEFQRSLVQGKPFCEVKKIYLEIKELKVALSARNGRNEAWISRL